ncbi:hypothetical protein O988_02711 [Pseudogymnoascus sp. VKM F-3808]|nr:hypothetical protein O988_02711 [Pseudogymnoascus sp. VKM F-3808]
MTTPKKSLSRQKEIHYLCTTLQKQKPTSSWKIVDPPQPNRNISPKFQKKVFRQFEYQRMVFYEGDEETSGMGYDEASNSLWKDWTMNSMLDNDLEKAQSNTWIDELLLNASLSETSSESGMDLLDWSIINDTFLDEKVSRPNGNMTGENANVSQQLKKRQNVRGRNSSKSVKARHHPARVGVTKILHHNKRDCRPQKIIKLRVGQKLVDLVNEWSEGIMEGNS